MKYLHMLIQNDIDYKYTQKKAVKYAHMLIYTFLIFLCKHCNIKNYIYM